MTEQKKKSKLLPILRRLLMGAVIFPPMVALTNIDKEPVPQKMKVVGERVIIPGSQLYLDRNPSF
jgi:hypothetical protein